MLGQMVKRVLSRQEELTVKSTSHYKKTLDSLLFNVENGIDGLRQILEQQKHIDYIINCIGILSSNIDENDQESVRRSILINALFPNELANLTQEFGVRVIQISTDGVFAKISGVCLEDSPCNCDDVYGKTRSLGEVNATNFLNLRCSIIGPSPYSQRGLLNWFLSLPKGSTVYGYTDQMWTGITTLQFSNLCHKLITDDFFDVVRRESAVHHFCPNRSVSKYELLQLFRSHFRNDIIVKPSINRDQAVSRTLDTKYNGIKEKFRYNNSMQKAIKELSIKIKTIK